MRNLIKLTKCTIINQFIETQDVLINPDNITVISRTIGVYHNIKDRSEVKNLTQINFSGSDKPILVLEDLETIQKLLENNRKLLE